MQRNLKRLVAYSSVAHMGFAIMGLFALNTEGVEGSVLQMVNHGISTGALFILLGFLYTRRHTYEIKDLKGIAKSAPVFAGIFTIVMLSLDRPARTQRLRGRVPRAARHLRRPPVVGGRRRGRRDHRRPLPARGPTSGSSRASPTRPTRTFPDLKLTERLVMVPLLVLIVFLGIYPKPVLDRIEPSVNRILNRMEVQVDRYDQPRTQNGSELARRSRTVRARRSDSGAEGEHAAGADAPSPGVTP